MGDRTPPRAPRQLRVENFAVRRGINPYNNVHPHNNVNILSFMNLNQSGLPAASVTAPAWWSGKTNQGMITIPADKKQNAMNITDIENGEEVVRIRQNNFDFFFRKENWEQWMASQLSQRPNRAVVNPSNRVPVTAEQIDIFTAQVQAGGKRRKTRRQSRRRQAKRRSSRRN